MCGSISMSQGQRRPARYVPRPAQTRRAHTPPLIREALHSGTPAAILENYTHTHTHICMCVHGTTIPDAETVRTGLFMVRIAIK